MKRVFLALDLPEAVRRTLAVQQFLLPLPRRVDPDQMHLTLVFVAEADMAALEAAHQAWSDLRVAPFEVTVAGLGLFGGARPRVAYADVRPDRPLLALQAKAETAARRAGCVPETRRFHPHVSLGRFPPPPPFEAMRLERAIAEGAGFACPPFPAREMVLYESLIGGKAVRHVPLARYPFTA